MTRMSRARIVVLALVLCVVVPCWPAAAPAAIASLRQDDALSPVEIGAGPIGERAFELVGRERHDAGAIVLFGYLTTVIGLDPALLFVSAPPSAGTARFTYAGQIALSSDSSRADVTELAGDGVVRIYLDDDAGATWDDAASFAAGEPVAEFSIRLRETIHRQAPGVGSVVGDAQLTQETAGELTLGDERYRFGNTGIAQRLRTVGALIGDDAEQGVLTIALTGRAAVTEREVSVVRLGIPATPAPSATQLEPECDALESWLTDSSERLAQAEAAGAIAAPDAVLGAIDAEGARQATETVAALAEAQRGSSAPAAASDAGQLVVTALSTYTRGLDAIVSAAEEGDEALLRQGQSVLGDGVGLVDRARAALTDLSAACPPA
jgi:hypothetical protein